MMEASSGAESGRCSLEVAWTLEAEKIFGGEAGRCNDVNNRGAPITEPCESVICGAVWCGLKNVTRK
jgi:hypothetical protein